MIFTIETERTQVCERERVVAGREENYRGRERERERERSSNERKKWW